MDVRELPLITRLTVVALGRTAGNRALRALDPVAEWMLERVPGLVPEGIAPAALSTIRARTEVVDRLLSEAVERARTEQAQLCLWSVGAGLDARWQRMRRHLGPVAEIREVDTPEVLSFKEAVLARSPYAEPWSRVARRPSDVPGWTVRPRSHTRPLVVLEGPAGRLPPDALERLLRRIRFETPDATVILGLPGTAPRDGPDPWTRPRLAADGWRIREDVHLGPRGRLVSPRGEAICPGMYPLRVLELEGHHHP